MHELYRIEEEDDQKKLAITDSDLKGYTLDQGFRRLKIVINNLENLEYILDEESGIISR